MGYYTTLSGTLTVEPALTDAELGRIADVKADPWTDLILQRTEGDEDTLGLDDKGKIIVVKGTRRNIVSLRSDEPTKNPGTLTEAIHALTKLARKHKVKVNGSIFGSGEEPGDLWRIRVEDNVVHEERPKLLWPNGDSEDL